jgi:hypothetical protein
MCVLSTKNIVSVCANWKNAAGPTAEHGKNGILQAKVE